MNDSRAPAPKPPKLVSVDDLLAEDIRGQARAVMRWALALNKAQLAGDWSEVERVRKDIADTATGLATFAIDLEERSKRSRR